MKKVLAVILLAQTDLDPETTAAARVSLLDTEKARADQAIRFTDASGKSCLCYFGDQGLDMERLPAGA